MRDSHVSHTGSRARPRINLLSTAIGTGAVYSFDPVGSYEREACRAAGAAQSLVQPFLDNQVRRPLRCCCHHRAQVHTPNDFTLDLFQESDTGPRNQSSHASPSPRRTLNRHRLVHECDGAPHRGPYTLRGSMRVMLTLFAPTRIGWRWSRDLRRACERPEYTGACEYRWSARTDYESGGGPHVRRQERSEEGLEEEEVLYGPDFLRYASTH